MGRPVGARKDHRGHEGRQKAPQEQGHSGPLEGQWSLARRRKLTLSWECCFVLNLNLGRIILATGRGPSLRV